MKRFFKDYGELCKATGTFYKKHWLGTIVLNVVVFLVTILLTWPKELLESLVDDIKVKFRKGES